MTILQSLNDFKIIHRSSSMHDLARVKMESSDGADGGVKWKDEQKLPNIGMPGLGVNGRTLSTKSLHMLGGGGQENMMWNTGGVWPATAPGMNFGLAPGQGFHPMLGGWGPVPGVVPGQLGAMR